MYQYRARVIAVHDGDTCRLDVDLGFRVHADAWIRLAGINTPELHHEGGRAARERLANLLSSGELLIRTTRDRTEKYGRMLATIEVV